MIGPAQQVQPLLCWRDAQKETVRQRVEAVHRGWCADWLPAGDGLIDEASVRLAEPDAAAAPAPAPAPAHAIGWQCTSPPLDAIAARLFGLDKTAPGIRDAGPGVADDVVQAAWSDWLQRLATLFGGLPVIAMLPAADAPAANPVAAWSGALVVTWSWCGHRWTLCASHAAISTLLGGAARPVTDSRERRAPLLALDHALHAERIVLRVALSGAQLDLGQLQDLRVGDVVPLAHPVADAARVLTERGVPVCDAWLGQSQGHVAVELAHLASNPT